MPRENLATPAGNHCLSALQRRPLGQYRYVRLRWRIVFAVIDFLGDWVFRAAGALRGAIPWLVAAPAAGKSSDPRVILLLQLDHLGDAVLSTGMVSALHQRWPAAAIEVLASPSNRALFAALPEVSRVYVSQANRLARTWWARFAWIISLVWWGLRLRWRGVDLGIDIRGEFPLALILWLSGARTRLGWKSGGGGFLLTHSARYAPDRAEIDSRRALLAELGIAPPDDPDFCRPHFVPSAGDRQRIAERLSRAEAAQVAGGPRLLLHLGAGTAAKRWPVENWRALLQCLRIRHDARVILVGGQREQITARRVLGTRAHPGVEDWCGQISVMELAAALEQADLAVSADSGPAHLAAAVGTPVVVLFSGTNRPAQWAPAGQGVAVVRNPVVCSPCHREHCALPDHPCMAGLRPSAVLQAIEQRLNLVGEGLLR